MTDKVFNGALFLIFTGPVSSYHPCSIQNTARGWHLLRRVVDVVDQVLHNSGGIGGLHALAVVGDDGAGGGANDDGTLLALYTSESASFALRGVVPSRRGCGVTTFLR